MNWYGLKKIIGGICVLLAFFYLGCRTEQNLKHKRDFWREMITLFCFLEQETFQYHVTVSEVLKESLNHTGITWQVLLSDMIDKFDLCTGMTFQEIWEQTITEHLKCCYWKEEDVCFIKRGVRWFQGTDTMMQENMMKNYISQLREKEELAALEYNEKGQLYRKLTICGGVFLVLLFL